jgi:hypothetical protein
MCGLLRILIPPTKLLKSHGNKKQLPLVFFVLLSLPLFHPPLSARAGTKENCPRRTVAARAAISSLFLYKSA